MLGFAPILLIPGPTGEYLGQLGGTVIACLFVSLLLSLTVVPVVATWALQLPGERMLGPVSVTGWYTRQLAAMFARPRLTIALSVLLPAAGFVAASRLNEQFFPPSERNHFHFSVRLPTYSSILDTERAAKQARDVILRYDDVKEVSLFVGMNAPSIHYSMLASDDSRPDFAQGIVQLNTDRVDPNLIHRIQSDLDASLPEAQSVVTMLEQGAPTTGAN